MKIIHNLNHLFKNRGSILKNPKLILLVNAFIGLLLIVAILFFIRDAVLISFSHEEEIIRHINDERVAERDRRSDLQDYVMILRNNPFGFPAGELRPLPGHSAPDAQIKVKHPPVEILLRGTVSDMRNKGYAIIASKDGQDEIFRIEDSVFGMGFLKKVKRDSVIIDAHGRSVTVPIEDMLQIQRADRSGSVAKRTDRVARDRPPASTEKRGALSHAIDRRKILAALKNPKQVLTDARILPYFVDGKQKGLILREVRRGGMYHDLGLRNGDIILRLNKHELSNPQSLIQTFTALEGMDRVKLDIIRGGANMTMTFNIK